MSNTEQAKWYILHTYSGYENIVKANLEQMIENNGLQNQIIDIKIPTEQTIEERNGKKKAVESKIMPCYVFVKLIYSSELWYMLTYNTRGVTGFVGPQGRAWPLEEDEVKRLRLEEAPVDLNVAIGDNIRVINGPFEGLIGVVKSIDATHQKVGLMLNMFGRDTPVDMDFAQIEILR
ncbi:MAG: transcription termination/antitermination factor NusG [Clostridia bacterium]|nr:transcription termination/antitermination factor NusG [Clostridia bacterium]